MKQAILFSVVVLVFCSCGNSINNDLVVLKTSTKNLEKSSQVISASSQHYYQLLHNRLSEILTAEKAGHWQPIAEKIHRFSTSVLNHIDSLKNEFKSGANTTVDDNDPEPGDIIFMQKKKGEELFRKLILFTKQIDEVDEEIRQVFSEIKKEVFDYLPVDTNNLQQVSKQNLNSLSKVAALNMLAKYENDVKIYENKLVEFCYNQTFIIYDVYRTFGPIVGQSSNCVKAGDEVQITAGVGSFSTESQPIFTIDGKTIPLNADGFVEYKFKTPLNAGEYSKPVKIEYTKPDGTKALRVFNISYTVIDPKQIQ